MVSRKLLAQVRLASRHSPTGKTSHFRGNKLLPSPSRLAIVQYPGDSGFYLCHYNARGLESTDTYHETLEAAFAQALWEFGIRREEWIRY
mgnify:CR=1 FL=1